MNQRSRQQHPFAICVRNRGYRASLETWKIYRVVVDRTTS
jgi:hypothetical protein